MALARLTILLGAIAGLSACGGTPDLSCDEEQIYQLAAPGQRVVAPQDLDDLEPLREMPLPEASPRPPRDPNSPCIELPPSIVVGE